MFLASTIIEWSIVSPCLWALQFGDSSLVRTTPVTQSLCLSASESFCLCINLNPMDRAWISTGQQTQEDALMFSCWLWLQTSTSLHKCRGTSCTLVSTVSLTWREKESLVERSEVVNVKNMIYVKQKFYNFVPQKEN